MAEDLDKDRLGKVVAMAKKGVGGEKDAAIAILKGMCKKHGLSFDDIMSEDAEVREYTIPYADQDELRIVQQVVCRYAYLTIDDQQGYNALRKLCFFKTTKEKYYETLHASDVLKDAWHVEKKKLADIIYFAFIERHCLYYIPTREDWLAGKVKPDKSTGSAARLAGAQIAGYMDEKKIRKPLK